MVEPGGSDLVEAEREIHQAVAEILGRRGLLVTKWLAAVEVIEESGERDLKAFASPDYRAWDSVGMLGFLDARERGVVGAEAAREWGPDAEG